MKKHFTIIFLIWIFCAIANGADIKLAIEYARMGESITIKVINPTDQVVSIWRKAKGLS